MDTELRAAVEGAVVGMALGQQRQGRHDYSPVSYYDPVPSRLSASSSLEAWPVWINVLKQGAAPVTLASQLARHWSPEETESAFGLANVNRGIGAPASGSFNNPLALESSALGRCVFWGLAFRGRPDRAAEFAYWDASIDHAGEGVWVPTAVAYALASIRQGDDAKSFVDAFVYALPRQSRLRACIPTIIKSVADPDGARKIHGALFELLATRDVHAASYAGAALAFGLVAGGGSFDRSIIETVAFGGASAQAGIACGAASATLSGGVPERWISPIEDRVSFGARLQRIDAPSGLIELAEAIESVASPALGSLVPDPVSDGTPAPPAARSMVPIPFDLSQEPNYIVLPFFGVSAFVYYLSSPCFFPGETVNLSMAFVNTSEAALDLRAQVTPPPGWECAHRISEFSLVASGHATFPVVMRCANPALRNQFLEVKIGEIVHRVPLIAPQRWYQVGPLLNQEGTGFDREYPAQNNVALGAVFNGRSDMPVEWRESLEGSCQFDVEALMAGGPGAAYYFARAVFETPGSYRLVVAAGVGAIVFIDGRKIHWYHDTHAPVPRPSQRYTAMFETTGTTDILIKTLRNLEPIPPMTVYFLDAKGRVVFPIDFLPL